MMQRTIRFLLASKAEESAINSTRNAAGNRLRDVRETFAQHSRAHHAADLLPLIYERPAAQQAYDSNVIAQKIGRTCCNVAKEPRAY